MVATSSAGRPGREETRRLDRAQSLLLIVDIQERLAPHILHGEALIARGAALLAAARRFGIPAIVTEHCPDQIGPVVAGLRQQFSAAGKRLCSPDKEFRKT